MIEKNRLAQPSKALSVWAYLLAALCAVLLLLGLKLLLEKVSLGRRAELAGYHFLAEAISRYRADGQAAVVIGLRPLQESPVGKDGEPPPFPRDDLRRILVALHAVNSKAVGIDMDFSPTRYGWRDTENDEQFLNECLSFEGKMPVRLGVYRAIREPSDAWLGAPRFAPLAGGIWIHNDDGLGHMRLPVWTRAPGVHAPLPTLGAAVAAAAREGPRTHWNETFFGRLLLSESLGTHVDRYGNHVFEYGEIPINYGSTSQIAREARLMAADDWPSFISRNASLFENKLVFIGDAREGTKDGLDAYKVNALNSTARGVVLHATLAQTLTEDRLFEPTHLGRVVLDVGISLVVIALNVHFQTRWRSRRSARALVWQRRVYFGSILAVTLLGFSFLALLDVLWLDFLAVAGMLAIHPGVERLLHKVLTWRLHADASRSAS